MYRSCIFCSAPLGSNESIERFPVGRSLAFDGEKGRLWAVCGKCARWNLAPLEERWEAIEDAERLFRDTRMRVQSENIGLAKLRDGTRLVRVGEALTGELALWRYGETLTRRRRRYGITAGVAAAVGGVGAVAGVAGAGISLTGGVLIYRIVHNVWAQRRELRVVHRFRPSADSAQVVTVRRRDVADARLVEDGGGGVALRFLDPWEPETLRRPPQPFAWLPRVPPLLVTGEPARTLLARGLVHVNDRGARRQAVDGALRRIEAAGSAGAFLQAAAHEGRRVATEGSLALEMALHEETERRALHGELAALEAMWRQAEEIAAIADRLPDLPAPEPPRLIVEG